jgi:hypothetical protein
VDLNKARAGQHVAITSTPCSNSFEGLVASESVIADDDGVEATPVFDDTSAQKFSTCVQCGKQVADVAADMATDVEAGVAKCAQCRNHSFTGLVDQLSGEHLVADVSNVAIDNKLPVVEIVPLNQFTRAGKRGMYETCGVISLR